MRKIIGLTNDYNGQDYCLRKYNHYFPRPIAVSEITLVESEGIYIAKIKNGSDSILHELNTFSYSATYIETSD